MMSSGSEAKAVSVRPWSAGRFSIRDDFAAVDRDVLSGGRPVNAFRRSLVARCSPVPIARLPVLVQFAF
jgi:hypothetical protein